jgi:hypothetical protein
MYNVDTTCLYKNNKEKKYRKIIIISLKRYEI